jgi:hypothetical protein
MHSTPEVPMKTLHPGCFATVALAGLLAVSPVSYARDFHGGDGFHGGGFQRDIGRSGDLRGGFERREFRGGELHARHGFGDRDRVRGGVHIYLGAPLSWPPYEYYPPDYYYYPPPGLPSGYYYYCADPPGYYPVVRYCPSGWLTVIPPGG